MPPIAAVLYVEPPSLAPGETPMPHAPQVVLANGASCIPQHYLQYRQTEASVQAIVSDIDFDEFTPVFVSSDQAGLYLQAGLIGRENYDRSNTVRPYKLVYGRKWRIDSDTPTSEVIQTALLAIKKAREHEVRELLTIVDGATGKVSAPFSNHHDLPLMAANVDLVQRIDDTALPSENDIRGALADVRFAQRPLRVLTVQQRSGGGLLVDLQLGQAPLARMTERDLAEFDGLVFTVLLPVTDTVALLYGVMDALVAHSDRFVEENFRYRGVARFSRLNDPRRIAALSIATRPYARDAANALFAPVFKSRNYEVDASRAPSLGTGRLADKNRNLMNSFHPLGGHMPKGF